MKRIFRVIISISLLCAFLVGLVFFVLPSYQEFAVLNAQVKEMRSRIEHGRQALTQLRRVDEGISAHQENFIKLERAIPIDAGLPVLYEHIQNMGTTSGLVVVSLEGAPVPGPTEEIVALVFTVNFVGSYEGLKNFLDETKRSARIFNVNTIGVSSNPEIFRELDITIEIFAYAVP